MDPNLTFHVEDGKEKGEDDKLKDGTEQNDEGQRQGQGAAKVAKL